MIETIRHGIIDSQTALNEVKSTKISSARETGMENIKRRATEERMRA